MAFTSKVSQVIKGRINAGANSVKGFVDGIAGDIIGITIKKYF